VFDKLKSVFSVKEQQDFRNLYTDPPISFAQDFPLVPNPDSELSPKILAARWVTHDLYGEAMPSIAAGMLEAGYDSPALRRLAAEIRVECSADVEDLVGRVFRELGVSYPMSEIDANLIFSRQIAREVIAGKRNAWAAASNLTIAVWSWRPPNLDLGVVVGLLDALDWDAVNHDKLPEMTMELVGALARIGAEQ
jgi:hypothetical protein